MKENYSNYSSSGITKRWSAAIYCRLSSDDGSENESNSIINQRDMILQYVNEDTNIKIIDSYIDDGYTGTNFNRPEFVRMYKDIKNRKINMIIVKDLSRFGRNYIEVGKYFEEIFPMYNIRFISINDNIDSFKDPASLSSIVVPFKNLINDQYAKDISKKVRSAYKTLAENGKYAGGTTPYGYKKNPLDKHQLVIDKDEALVVKKIFTLAKEGNGALKIVQYLITNNILSRKEKQRRLKHNISLVDNSKNVFNWGSTQIQRTLNNEMYLGHLIFGKSTTISYKNKKQIWNTKDKIIKVENTHEPIISQELFYEVQKIIKDRKKNSRKRVKDEISIYKGKLKCMHCGKQMHKRKDTRVHKNTMYYSCVSNVILKTNCNAHSINSIKLDKVVIESIIMFAKLVMDVDKTINSHKKSNYLTDLKQEYETIKRCNEIKIDELKAEKRKIYEAFKLKKIERNIFEDKMKTIEESSIALNLEIEKGFSLLNIEVKKQKKHDSWIEHFRRNKKVKSLSKELLDELIEMIYIDNRGNVNIEFKYRDEYEHALKEFNMINGVFN